MNTILIMACLQNSVYSLQT